jgi:hypothetical protein
MQTQRYKIAFEHKRPGAISEPHPDIPFVVELTEHALERAMKTPKPRNQEPIVATTNGAGGSGGKSRVSMQSFMDLSRAIAQQEANV